MDAINKKTRLKSAQAIPKNVEDFLADCARSIIRRNWGSNLTLEYYKSGFSAIKAMMEFPFEPNLYDIKHKLEHFPVRRFDQNGYNSTCLFLKIPSFKSLRKAYSKNPLALLSFKGLLKCGFTDKNFIIKVLDSNLAKLFEWNFYKTDYLAQFCRIVIPLRGEGPVLTMLSHNFFDAQKIARPELCTDTAAMAVKWLKDENQKIENPKIEEGQISLEEIDDLLGTNNQNFSHLPTVNLVKLPDSLRADLIKNGLTKNNHDALQELDYLRTHRVISFKYLKKQLALEDDIDGYSFRLPVDSKQLYIIGQNLHNCVNSYSERVEKRACTIIFATKNGEYRLCIEVRGEKIHQQRADRNATPCGEDEAVLRKWRIRHRLSFSGNSF